jgi:hypothetical protein
MISLGVFFPALMGIGILASGALLLADLVRRLMPNRGRRRRYRIAVGTYGVIALTARAADVYLEPPAFLTRRRRNRATYALAAAISIGLGIAALTSGLAAYRDSLGVFYQSPWAIGLGIGVATGMFLIAAVALALAAAADPGPRPLNWIVEHSPYGRITVPERFANATKGETP